MHCTWDWGVYNPFAHRNIDAFARTEQHKLHRFRQFERGSKRDELFGLADDGRVVVVALRWASVFKYSKCGRMSCADDQRRLDKATQRVSIGGGTRHLRMLSTRIVL